MRKLIVIIFVIIGITCAVLTVGASGSLIPEEMRASAFDALPVSLQDDIQSVQASFASPAMRASPLNSASQASSASPLSVFFSHTEHFYSETISVSITASSPNAVIYYTTDGSAPTADDNHLYTEPLELIAGDELQCIVLKAIAIEGFNLTSVLTHTYFVGLSVDERFSTYVFSISTDHDNLYGYEYGILVPGRIYGDFMEENPDTDLEERRRPYNFSMRGWEWERPIHMEVFTYEGECVIAQNAGIRTHGGSSRFNTQKPLRLIARRMYSPETGMFHFEFFENYDTHSFYPSPILAHDTLVLRNDWGDRYRNLMLTQVAREAGYSSATPVAAGCVFINGVYYGYVSINLRFHEHFLQNLYVASDRNFEIIRYGGYPRGDSGYEESRRELNRLIEYAEQGFIGEQIQYLHEMFDVDDLLLHYAIRTYIGDADWKPSDGKNIRLWRYVGTVGESNPTKELDGRWRHDMHDLDFGMGRNGRISPDDYEASIKRVLKDCLIFSTITQHPEHPEYAEQFANYICDMAFEHFSASNLSRVYSELIVPYMQERLITASQEEHDEGIRLVIDFAERRPQYILDELRELFGFTEMYRIVSDGAAKINTLNGLEGTYFVENSVPIYPILEKGQVFDYWLVNGEKRYEEDLMISFSDADKDGAVYVKLVTREELPPLFFADTYDTGDLFGFTMYNPTSVSQQTQGLYLSDNIENLKKWQFPDLNIRSGATWEFVGRNSTSLDALLKIRLSFNPRHGEVVFLSNADGEILDWIAMKP